MTKIHEIFWAKTSAYFMTDNDEEIIAVNVRRFIAIRCFIRINFEDYFGDN